MRKITIGFEFKHRAVIVNKLYFLNSTIKLYYFSTVGLIAAKVLKSPPRQSFAAARPRPVEKNDSDDDNEHDDVKEERSSQRRRLDNPGSDVKVTTVVRTQTIQYLDLTNDDCSI